MRIFTLAGYTLLNLPFDRRNQVLEYVLAPRDGQSYYNPHHLCHGKRRHDAGNDRAIM